MPWWPFAAEPDEPPTPATEPDPGSIYCQWCHVGRWRFNDVLICATCDNPPTEGTTP